MYVIPIANAPALPGTGTSGNGTDSARAPGGFMSILMNHVVRTHQTAAASDSGAAVTALEEALADLRDHLSGLESGTADGLLGALWQQLTAVAGLDTASSWSGLSPEVAQVLGQLSQQVQPAQAGEGLGAQLAAFTGGLSGEPGPLAAAPGGLAAALAGLAGGDASKGAGMLAKGNAGSTGLQAAFASLLENPALSGAERTLLSGSVEPLARAIAALQSLRGDADAAGDTPAGLAPGGPPVAGQATDGRTLPVTRPEALPPRVATLDTVGDVALRSVRFMAAEGERTFTVRLVPASLGEVRIDVTQAVDGALTVRLASAHADVRHALEAQLQSLRQTLAREQGQAVEVAIAAQMGGGQDASRSHGGRAAPQDSRSQTQAGRSGQRGGPASVVPVDGPANRARHGGALNLFV